MVDVGTRWQKGKAFLCKQSIVGGLSMEFTARVDQLYAFTTQEQYERRTSERALLTEESEKLSCLAYSPAMAMRCEIITPGIEKLQHYYRQKQC